MEFADYKIEEDGLTLCEPCLCFVYFSDAVLTKEEPPDMLGPYRTFLAEFKNSIAFSRTDGNQMHAKKVSQEDFYAWPNWLNDPKRRSRGDFGVELRSGKTRDEWVSPCLEVGYSTNERSNTYYRICVPLSWLNKEGYAGVVKRIEESLVGFPLHSGYVGYSFSWEQSTPHVIDVTAPYFSAWLQRHPGIVAPEAGTQSLTVPFSFADIGWITLLGSPNVSRLGGFSALQDALAHVPSVVVSEIGSGGASIRIGDSPRLGDINANDALEDYRAVGQVLSPLRDRAILEERWAIAGLKRKHSPEARTKWINRFFPTN